MMISLPYIMKKYRMQIHGVIHVGAHLGEEHGAYEAAGIKDVLWVEGDPDVFKKLKKQLGSVELYRFAKAIVCDRDHSEVTFRVANNEQSSSILELGTHSSSHPEVEYVKERTLPTRTIDSLIWDEWKAGEYVYRNMMNLDIQGAELLALQGASATLGDIDYVYCEVNTNEVYVDCAQMSQIDAFLRDFRRVETKMTKHAWGDAVYIRKSIMGRRQ